MIGVICATDEELSAVLDLQGLSVTVQGTVAGVEVYQLAWSDGHPVIAAKTGMGKVNAAMVTTLLCSRYQCEAIVFVGVAGALDPAIRPGDVVWLSHVACHDYGLRTCGDFIPVRPGVLPLGAPRACPEPIPNPLGWNITDLRPLPDERLLEGGAVTGDAFIQDPDMAARLRGAFGAAVVDMESYAVFQVCRSFETPLVILRSISDDAGDASGADYVSNVAWSGARVARYVRRIVDRFHALKMGLNKAAPEEQSRPAPSMVLPHRAFFS